MSNETGTSHPSPEDQYKKKVLRLMLLRGRRLLKLIKLNAPELILCNEVNMLHNMLPLLGKSFKASVELEADRQIGIQKNLLDYCSTPNCFNRCSSEQVEKEHGKLLCQECNELLQEKYKAWEKAWDESVEEIEGK